MGENSRFSWLGCMGLILALALLGTLIKLGQWLANEGRGILIVLIIALAAVAGFYIYAQYMRKQKTQKQAEIEQQTRNEKLILRLAAENKGYITAAEVSLNSELSIEEAGKALDELKTKGACILRISDSGTYVYQFELLSYREKQEAERI